MVEFVHMEQSSLASVKDAAKAILSKTDKIHILVNNAGIMMVPDRRITEEGFELHFVVNHLSHFLLFQLLEPVIEAASTPEFRSRVICVATDAEPLAGVNERGNYNFEHGKYNGSAGYTNSKSANIYMAIGVDKRYASRGIHGLTVNPGVVYTSLARYLNDEETKYILKQPLLKHSWQSPAQGAATTVWASVSPEVEGKGPLFIKNSSIAALKIEGQEFDPEIRGHHYTKVDEERIWEDSLDMVKKFI